jgi:hypothetical protein
MQRAARGAQVGCMRIQLTVVLLLSGIVATPVIAQDSRDSARARAIEALPIGITLRLVAAGHEYSGMLVQRSPLSLTLDRNGSYLDVPRTEVQALWNVKGRATLDGFITGAVLGGIAGGVVGYFAGSFMCESECHTNMRYGAAIGVGAGGLALGSVGALIGSAFTTWERRFP